MISYNYTQKQPQTIKSNQTRKQKCCWKKDWKKQEITNEQILTNKAFCSLVEKDDRIKGLRGWKKEREKNSPQRMSNCKKGKE